MNVEVVPKQGKLSKGVFTMKVVDGMLHKPFSFTAALMHDWKMYGTKKENGDIEIRLTHKHFEPIVFDRVLRFENAILVVAKIKTLPINVNQEVNFQENVTPSDWTCWTTADGRYSEVLWSTNHRSGNEVPKLFFREDQTKEYSQEE